MSARRSVDFWVDKPGIDYALTSAGVIGALVATPHGFVDHGDRAVLYQTLASVSGILLSLGTIIVTLIFTVTPNDRLERLIRTVGYRLLRLVISSLTMLAVTAIGFILLFALDSADSRVRLAATTALVLMMLLRFIRLWWLLNQVLYVLLSGMTDLQPEAWDSPGRTTKDYKIRRRRVERSSVAD